MKTLIQSTAVVDFQKIEASCVFHNKHSHYTESSLIKKLEDLGIGRPSTYAMFIETIQERGYVKKEDISGEKRSCREFVLRGKTVTETTKDILVGNEKNKLVVQPIGIIVVEFLSKYFGEVFSYGYTKELEENLDKISTTNVDDGGKWYDICEQCSSLIKTAIKPITAIFKEKYPLDENHAIVFSKNGPIVQCGDETTMSIRKDLHLDIDLLKTGGYKTTDVVETDEKNRLLGKWEGEDIFLKSGRYGHYLEWGSQKKAVVTKTPNTITIENIPELLSSKMLDNKNVLRILNDHLSIRRGKFGAYIYYKTPEMAKPEFLSLKKFGRGFSTCEKEVLAEWIQKTHNIVLEL